MFQEDSWSQLGASKGRVPSWCHSTTAKGSILPYASKLLESAADLQIGMGSSERVPHLMVYSCVFPIEMTENQESPMLGQGWTRCLTATKNKLPFRGAPRTNV